jgi:hypothetical protein
MNKPIVRRVFISKTHFSKLQHNCLVCSEYGNTQLYDTCEWRPITGHDLLLLVLKHNLNNTDSADFYFYHYQRWAYDYYHDYKFWLDAHNYMVGKKRHSRHVIEFGWATVTKNNFNI